jgi:hypothetical protein
MILHTAVISKFGRCSKGAGCSQRGLSALLLLVMQTAVLGAEDPQIAANQEAAAVSSTIASTWRQTVDILCQVWLLGLVAVAFTLARYAQNITAAQLFMALTLVLAGIWQGLLVLVWSVKQLGQCLSKHRSNRTELALPLYR